MKVRVYETFQLHPYTHMNLSLQHQCGALETCLTKRTMKYDANASLDRCFQNTKFNLKLSQECTDATTKESLNNGDTVYGEEAMGGWGE